MARVQLGPIAADIRGKVGGAIFQRSAHGLALRPYTSPVNPRSVSQSSNKSAIAQLQTAWQQLTDAQRTAWRTWSEFQNLLVGQFVHAAQTGQQSFIQINRYRLLVGDAIIEDPVFSPYSLATFTPSLTFAAAVLSLFLDTTNVAADYRPVLQLSFPLTPSRYAQPAGVRFLPDPTGIDDETWDYTAPYLAVFGIAPAVGNRIWHKLLLQQRDNGTLSVVSSGVLTVTA